MIMYRLRAVTIVLAAIHAQAAGAASQDLFGSAVAVSRGDVLVAKPGTARGSAAVLVFGRASDGTWLRRARLEPIDAPPGEGFGASLAATADVLLVAAADPEAAWAAHVFRRSGDDWVAAGRIPWDATTAPARFDAATLDLAAIIRIAQPPPRIVALAPDGALAAVARATPQGGPAQGGAAQAGATQRNEVIVVHARAGDAAWVEEARLRPQTTGTADGFGAALAISTNRMAVGAPATNDRGVVLIFARQDDGSWNRAAEIQPPPDFATGALFGAALAFDGDRLLIGAPGAGVVLAYRATGAEWSVDQTLRPVAVSQTTTFGTSIGLHTNELWIGAPATDSTTGAVYRFLRTSPSSPWSAPAAATSADLMPRSALGAAIGLGAGIIVAGAPQSHGSHGLAAVWTVSTGGELSSPVLLEPAEALRPVTGGEVRCANGEAEGFACGNVDLLAFLPIAAIGGEPGEHVSDLWGWTDPETKREYALVGRNRGIAMVDVTDPAEPVYLGVLPGNRAGARDVKVFRDHLFFVGDWAGEHGLLIFDLKRLRTLRETPVEFTADARYDGMASAHNLVMDTETGTAIPVGASDGGNTCGGGLHMVDVSSPVSPVFAGCYTDTEGLIWKGRTHDAQCVVYRGPDARYSERQICFVANETALRIVDITDKIRPAPISSATYPTRAYVHQGWLTEDQRYFFMNDEADELLGLTARTRTLIWDVADLEDPILAGEYLGPDASTDHNLYINGNRMYLANYQAGVRVVDISDPLRPVEIGFFDTTPYGGNPPGWFGGAWSAYPFLESGTVLVSSINEGLFLLRPRERPVS
ncbi:MAG: choice-of-anchor B family protein [Longimicrobiales bacterium]